MNDNCFYCKHFKEHKHFYFDFSSLYEYLKPNNNNYTNKCGSYQKIDYPSSNKNCFESF